MYGDVIFVTRKRLGFKSFQKIRGNEHTRFLDSLVCKCSTFKHFGVEVEDGMVIHFVVRTLHRPKDCVVEKVPMAYFVKDGKKEVAPQVNYAFPRDEIVKRAEQMLSTRFYGYHLLENNCEHFAYWCATGERQSKQIWELSPNTLLELIPNTPKVYGQRVKHLGVKIWKLCTSFYR